jgi:maltose alpha-D-glucosyltransferase/alpha-amylase
MQWSPDRNAGFSRADPQRLFLPPIMDPIYGYGAVNVEAQARDPSSQLNWMKHMLAVRKTSHAFGRGKLTFLRPGNRKILAYIRETADEAVLCVANLARTAQPVELDLKRFKGRVPVEMLGRTAFPPVGELPYMLSLPAHGFYWFRLTTNAQPPEWHMDLLINEEKPVLVLFDGWNSLFREKVVPWRVGMAEKLRAQLEGDVLPRYVEQQRWYAAKGRKVEDAPLADWTMWDGWLITLSTIHDCRYFVPLSLAWEDADDALVKALASLTLARVRQQANVGVLAEAVGDAAFCRAVAKEVCRGGVAQMAHGELRFTPTSRCIDFANEDFGALQLSRLHTQSTNTSAVLTSPTQGDRLFLKFYRRLREGMNPEFEVGRFLTEVARFPHCVPLTGSIDYLLEGKSTTLGLMQAYVPNQGDGWGYTLNYLDRFLEDRRSIAAAQEEEEEADGPHGAYITLMQTLATRTAELHAAFAMKSGDPAFEPEPFTAQDVEDWKQKVRREAEQTFQLLKKRELDTDVVFARIDACRAPKGATLKSRHHGDYHLGQVLIANNDFVIIDFEGEPSRPLEESRRKHSPLRDVAGMLRSFNYAKWSAHMRAREADPNTAKLMAELDAWEAQTRHAFLDAYFARTGQDLEDVRGLLDLAELEKALYELRYEASNRPDWIHIPLEGLKSKIRELPSKTST